MLRHELVWDEGVIASMKHFAGVVRHEGSCLYVKVAKHLVGTPAANQSDNIRIDFGHKQGIGTRSPEAPGRNVLGEKAKVGAEEGDTVTQCFRNESRRDVGWSERSNICCGQRRVARSVMTDPRS